MLICVDADFCNGAFRLSSDALKLCCILGLVRHFSCADNIGPASKHAKVPSPVVQTDWLLDWLACKSGSRLPADRLLLGCLLAIELGTFIVALRCCELKKDATAL